MIGTKFKIIDMSQIPEQQNIVTPDAAPVFFTAFPSAKGTEQMIEISGNDYRKMYGDPDFKKYGQVSIQNQQFIDNGAKLVAKRIVAADALLANTTVVAVMKTTLEDSDIQATGSVTVEVTDYKYDEYGEKIPVMVEDKSTVLNWENPGTYACNSLDHSANIHTACEYYQDGVCTCKLTDTPENSQDLEDKYIKARGCTPVYAQKQATDPEGNLIWEMAEPTTQVLEDQLLFDQEGNPIYEKVSTATVTYTTICIPNAKTMDDVMEEFGKDKIVDGKGIVLTEEDLGLEGPYGIDKEDDEVIFVPNDVNVMNDDVIDAYNVGDNESYNGFWIVPAKSVDLNENNEEVFNGTIDDVKGVYEVYPLFTIAELGRGLTQKSFLLTPDNVVSKNLEFMYYTLSIIEKGDIVESVRFAMLPDTIYRGKCIDLNMISSTGLNFSQAHCYEDAVNSYIEAIVKSSGAMSVDELKQHDFIFGTLRKGTPLDGIKIDVDNGLDMATSEVIVECSPAANGSFGSAPALNKPELITQHLLAFFSYNPAYIKGDGTTKNYKAQEYDITSDIYDLDTYQIDALFDSNMDITVKGAIAELANYRGDFHYFRDHGFDAQDFGTIYSMIEDGTYYKDKSSNMIKSTYVSDWVQAYEVINPYDMKQIPVTITYDIGIRMINHILNNVHVPFAGKRNNAIINSIIKNTLNYKPRKTPSVDEKENLEDIKCNFGSYYKSDFVIESLWTSQEDYTQLSFINNIMAVQRVIKALRVHFPSIRYQFITSTEDLQSYTTSINEFLASYTNMFAELRFEYIQDSVAAANKIYRAALYFRFNDFAQGEQIDAYMLPTEIITG